jgi:peptidoglycan/LPS O-acetylase OafA/YrhL
MNTIENQSNRKRTNVKRAIILIACMLAYGTAMMILATGGFKQQTIWFGVQCLNALGFFLAIAALLKKSNL